MKQQETEYAPIQMCQSQPTAESPEEVALPRVPNEPQLIVACPTDAVVTSERQYPCPPLPNYITQEDSDAPANNTRARRGATRSITQETILQCMEVSSASFNPKNLASRKFPLQFLCEMAGAVMDTNGDLLQYRHLIKRPEYREVWGGAYGKEVGRLAQGLPGVVEGTNTINFIHKHEVPDDRYKDVTYGQIVCIIERRRTTHTEHDWSLAAIG